MDKTPAATHPEAAAQGELLRTPDCHAGAQGCRAHSTAGTGLRRGLQQVVHLPQLLLCRALRKVLCSAAMLPAASCHSNPPKHAPLPPSFVSVPPSLAVHSHTHTTCCTTPKSLNTLLKGCSSPRGRKGGRGGSPPPQAIIPTCFMGKVPTLDPGASHPTMPSPKV